jgi:hypothetical protein
MEHSCCCGDGIVRGLSAMSFDSRILLSRPLFLALVFCALLGLSVHTAFFLFFVYICSLASTYYARYAVFVNIQS